ncbi:hypothetical protein BH24ACT19_BH24ACT19_12080 [soil metagenome]
MDDLAEQLEGPNPPIILDVRTRSQYERDGTRIPGSVRVMPDAVEDWAVRYLAEHPDEEPHLRPIAAYCTWPDEATSARAARRLNKLGFEATALKGGFDAWKAKHPVEPV